MKSMTGYNPGDVVLVPFPFSNLSGAKKRPALIMAASQRELVCLMLTSSPRGENEIQVRRWKEAGLAKPTVARVHRVFTIEAGLVLGKLGQVEPEEYREILAAAVAVLIKGKVQPSAT